jgi:hypothetical protein
MPPFELNAVTGEFMKKGKLARSVAKATGRDKIPYHKSWFLLDKKKVIKLCAKMPIILNGWRVHVQKFGPGIVVSTICVSRRPTRHRILFDDDGLERKVVLDRKDLEQRGGAQLVAEGKLEFKLLDKEPPLVWGFLKRKKGADTSWRFVFCCLYGHMLYVYDRKLVRTNEGKPPPMCFKHLDVQPKHKEPIHLGVKVDVVEHNIDHSDRRPKNYVPFQFGLVIPSGEHHIHTKTLTETAAVGKDGVAHDHGDRVVFYAAVDRPQLLEWTELLHAAVSLSPDEMALYKKARTACSNVKKLYELGDRMVQVDMDLLCKNIKRGYKVCHIATREVEKILEVMSKTLMKDRKHLDEAKQAFHITLQRLKAAEKCCVGLNAKYNINAADLTKPLEEMTKEEMHLSAMARGGRGYQLRRGPSLDHLYGDLAKHLTEEDSVINLSRKKSSRHGSGEGSAKMLRIQEELETERGEIKEMEDKKAKHIKKSNGSTYNSGNRNQRKKKDHSSEKMPKSCLKNDGRAKNDGGSVWSRLKVWPRQATEQAQGWALHGWTNGTSLGSQECRTMLVGRTVKLFDEPQDQFVDTHVVAWIEGDQAGGDAHSTRYTLHMKGGDESERDLDDECWLVKNGLQISKVRSSADVLVAQRAMESGHLHHTKRADAPPKAVSAVHRRQSRGILDTYFANFEKSVQGYEEAHDQSALDQQVQEYEADGWVRGSTLRLSTSGSALVGQIVKIMDPDQGAFAEFRVTAHVEDGQYRTVAAGKSGQFTGSEGEWDLEGECWLHRRKLGTPAPAADNPAAEQATQLGKGGGESLSSSPVASPPEDAEDQGKDNTDVLEEEWLPEGMIAGPELVGSAIQVFHKDFQHFVRGEVDEHVGGSQYFVTYEGIAESYSDVSTDLSTVFWVIRSIGSWAKLEPIFFNHLSKIGSPEQLVGAHVKVFWEQDDKWGSGQVIEHLSSTSYKILYDDRTIGEEDLEMEQCMLWRVSAAAGPSLAASSSNPGGAAVAPGSALSGMSGSPEAGVSSSVSAVAAFCSASDSEVDGDGRGRGDDGGDSADSSSTELPEYQAGVHSEWMIETNMTGARLVGSTIEVFRDQLQAFVVGVVDRHVAGSRYAIRSAKALHEEDLSAVFWMIQTTGSWAELPRALLHSPAQLVGRHIQVLWPEEGIWGAGQISLHLSGTTFEVTYSNQEVEEEDLGSEQCLLWERQAAGGAQEPSVDRPEGWL